MAEHGNDTAASLSATEAPTGPEAPGLKGASQVNKTRWADVRACAIARLGDTPETTALLGEIATALRFDPNGVAYNKQQAQRTKRWRHKRAETTGENTYITSGRKDSYYRKKAAAAATAAAGTAAPAVAAS